MATITEIAIGNADFSVLVATLQFIDSELESDLVGTLDDPSVDLTVFAPTNTAFADLAVDLGYAGDADDFDAVAAFLTTNVPVETLESIVLYHVSPTTQLSSDVAAAGTIATLNGATITPDLPTLIDNEPDLIDPSLVSVDTIADNGVVHVIDKVLLPIDLPGNDAPSITDIVASSGMGFDSNGSDFDILLAAVTTAGLDPALADPSLDATVFAPSDSAFIGLAQTLGFSGSDESGAWSYLVEALALLNGGDAVSLLTDVLTYHVSGESLQASQVLSRDEIDTLQGGVIGVDGTTLNDADPDLADPQIVATDIQAANGVVHVIDGVLLPADVLVSNGKGDVDFIIDGEDSNSFKLGDDLDFIDGNGGSDTVKAGADSDVVFGGSGRDMLLGNKGKDFVWGEGGADEIRGGKGQDELSGGNGDDTISGGQHADTVSGGSGDDVLNGGKSADVINGDDGMDVLNGGKNADVLNGGSGNDTLDGGKGADTFVFETGTDMDTIVDFEAGEDLIDLSDYGFASVAEFEDAISSDADGTTIDLGNGDSVLLAGQTGLVLTDADFIFA